MPDRENVIKGWETVLSRDPLDAPWDLIDETLAMLKDQEVSTLGMKITTDGFTFTAEGDAKIGEQRGTMLGKIYMYDQIAKELLHANLWTEEIKKVFDKVKRKMLED